MNVQILAAADATVSVIVHYPNGHVVEYQKQNAYSPEMIDKIFTSKLRSWPNGLPIQAFILPVNNPVHREFVHKYLNTNVYQIQRIWNRLIFSGRGIAPIELLNEEEMIQNVYKTPGAVGYISTRNLYRLSQTSILKESK
ncbi:hypothetical protein [Thiomicrorhabdus sp. 6S3-12]|uniref:hypothetical protein n=1 Tax=Thiomicrorhabdus sp. 6S3-12 TaxID=2819681 RepID=UPI001AADAD00|nr:hypothetical protein [Thiomicrorhabdus sp. 6S3-12]MBO1924459.1 hypothetical protein [Thiomicrorhabdus sp. 6S3-12]